MNSITFETLQRENNAFLGTGGRSEENYVKGFIPGFHNTETGEVHISCLKNGSPAPIHLLEGLPETWIKSRDPSGKIIAIKDSVVSGFIYHDRFYTRQQVAMIIKK